MKHVPHLVVGAPWRDNEIGLSVLQWRHVTKVLRLKAGSEVSYTDGLGRIGTGVLGHQTIERGEERTVERPNNLTIASAPPTNKDRQRFLVEKLAELSVARLLWLETSRTTVRLASPTKVFSWVLSGVEQSRGAYLMETSSRLYRLTDLEGDVVVCHPGGDRQPGKADVIAIGPEGGFEDEEIPDSMRRWDLGPTLLRVETAALVAAARATV
ncbi:MAG TPA: 16S rRNA (uracil(1498)-N(3))-methyltransferase [Acidimicrobiia bacterium]|jgi:RsmE family RNA methyltransferase|nr:16S rRNA (uracil(1498)-N(3))-methyltransferase [Acidimicrobiia bacterium]